MTVRRVFSGVVVFSVLLSLNGSPAFANEAQAALTGRTSVYQYEIPGNLSPEEKSGLKPFKKGIFCRKGGGRKYPLTSWLKPRLRNVLPG